MSEHKSTTIEQRLSALGIVLPRPAAPVANYVGAVLTGSMLVVSGQLCFDATGKLDPAHIGKLGASSSLEDGKAAARLCVMACGVDVSLSDADVCAQLGDGGLVPVPTRGGGQSGRVRYSSLRRAARPRHAI